MNQLREKAVNALYILLTGLPRKKEEREDYDMCGRPRNLNSAKLKNIFLKKFKGETGLTASQRAIRTEYFQSFQAHHIVPVEVIQEYSDSVDYNFYNQDWNCLMIPSYGDAIIHNGSHPQYNEFISALIKVYRQTYPDANLRDIAVGIADFIRMVLDNALVEERRQGGRISLNQFAEKYLWPVYG